MPKLRLGIRSNSRRIGPAIYLAGLLALASVSVTPAQESSQPWMDARRDPSERAELVLKELTLDEKIALLHGNGMPHVPK